MASRILKPTTHSSNESGPKEQPELIGQKDKSCFGCKLCATVMPLCLSAYILYAAKNQYQAYSGPKKFFYLTMCASLSGGLLFFGYGQYVGYFRKNVFNK